MTEWTNGKSPDPFAAASGQRQPVALKSGSMRDMRILLVEDFATMRRIIHNLLDDLGYKNVVEADSGECALSALENQAFDFVISDLQMPGISGMDLLRAIRADRRLCNIPVLFVTADANREKIIEAARAGVNGYIIKPFTAAMLENKILRILDRSNAG